MKASKIILPIVLVAAICLSWFSFITGTLSMYTDYIDCIREAENSIEAGLYEQAIENYKKSLEYKYSESYATVKQA